MAGNFKLSLTQQAGNKLKSERHWLKTLVGYPQESNCQQTANRSPVTTRAYIMCRPVHSFLGRTLAKTYKGSSQERGVQQHSDTGVPRHSPLTNGTEDAVSMQR